MPIPRPSWIRGRRASSLEGVFGLALAVLFVLTLLGPARAGAAVVCPNPVPVVNENECHTGTSSWAVDEYSQDLGGFTTKTSVNLGESVTLKIGRNGPVSPTRTVNISVYRMGYYQGLGARLVNSASNIAINNDFECEAMDPATGKVSCNNWKSTYTIPGSAFPASGVYLAKLIALTGDETQVVFTVRDDSHQPSSELLYVLPIDSYQAYNTFGGKSLYYGTEGGNTASGTSRAVKVSFDRPFAQAGAHLNWFTGPDFDLLAWLEKQGYDVAYTDDVQVATHPSELLNHDVDVISGHSEYWTEQQYKAFLAAREAGVNIASFSANTAYWKVRYEDGNRTLVCYKTVEGGGSTGSGSISENDWGPDGIKGTADDALGLDGKAGTADDNPQNSTTTFRDNGAPPGDPSAPPGGRVGPDMPENQLFGVMYVGDNDSHDFPLTVPPGNANEEFASNRIWRNTGIAENSSTNIGSRLVGWEWDAVPTQAQYLSREPSGVKHLFATNVQAVNTNSWLLDEGRLRNTEPPPGQPGTVGGVTYNAASGAEVFASGTMEWAYGLSSDPDERLEQATYNIFSDMGVQPNTPDEELNLDPAGSNRAPNGGFTISQNPAKTNTTLTFDASASHDPDGTIAKYEWDLDGNGSFETNTGSKATVTRSYSAEGEYTVRLRVTDNGGATDTAVRTLTIINNLPPTASFTTSPTVVAKGEPISFDGSSSKDPDGTIAKYEWDFDGNGTYETSGGSNPVISHSYPAAGTYSVGLRVTDNGGKTATTTRSVSVNSGEISKYTDSVLATTGLAHYWRMGETSGSTFADSKGSSPATAFGEPTLGVTGGVANDPDRAAQFDGSNDAAKAAIDLSGTHAATVEFWLKWDNFANDDRLAMELTPNFNGSPGGFLVDPDAPQFGGTFGVGIGTGTSRNTAYFERPSAGQWHHYAFVLDSSAPAAQQIIPYVDGKPVAYQKGDSGTGAGNFTNSTLNFMSRNAGELFGAGSLDEVAIYRRTLGPTTIADHYNAIVPTNGGEGGEEGGSGGEKEEGGGKEESGGSGGEGPATYSKSILATSTLLNYWRMGEAAGPTLADSKGSSSATATGGPTFGVPGSLSGDANTALRFDGINDSAGASLNLSGKSAITVEFWLKWNSYANDDRLAMELTNNFNENAGGFLVDPNAPQLGGTFGVGIGKGASRNNVFFARPTAGQWHHYAFVLDTNAPAAEQITPYVDGKAVTYSKLESGTGAGNFASSTLNMMSRAGSGLFGNGELDEVSIFGSALNAPTVANNFKGIVPEGGGEPEEEKEGKEETGTPSTYSESVLGTPGLADYWRLGEPSGSVFADSVGPSPASIAGEPAQGVNGAISGDADKAARFDGINDSASAAVNLSGKSAVTVEFWLKWNSYANDDRLAMEFTNNFNETPGGFLIDPNSGYGSFAVAIGSGSSRNVTLFQRPSAGEWHHYAFVLDTSAPAAEEVVPYVDGKAVTYSKPESGTGAPAFANSTLNFMSRAGSALFGAGDLDEVAIYDRALGATTVANHYLGLVTNKRPTASFTAPIAAKANEAVNFDASASSDPDGPIAKYEWDLDGDGSYETDTGTTPTVSHTYTEDGNVTVGLRVTDSAGSSAIATRTVDIEGEAGSGPKTYSEAVLGTSGLLDYWRLGEQSGSVLADSAGANPATTSGEPTLGVPGSIFTDSDTAVRFDGSNDAAGAPVDLSGTPAVTVEFWLKWNSYANDDRLAMEFTNNFNASPGGFLVDPNSGYGSFAVGIGNGSARNVTLFPRPSAGLWHHYAFVLDTTAPAAQQVVPYVDGEAVPYTKAELGTGGGNFANATLNFMSRAGSELFGAGDLDEVAIYGRALSGAAIAGHYTVGAHNMPPEASFAATPNPADTNATVSFDASASSDVDGTVAKYEWDLDGNGTYETNTGTKATVTRSYSVPGDRTTGLRVTDNKGEVGTATRTLTIKNQLPVASFTATPNPVPSGSNTTLNAAASSDPDGTIVKYEWDLDGNGSFETSSGATASVTTSYATPGERNVGLRVTDNSGDSTTTTRALKVENRAPTASFTTSPNPVLSGVSVNLDASASSDPDGSIATYEWDLDGNGSYETSSAGASTTTSFATPGEKTIGLRVTDDSGATATTTRTVTVQNRPPTASFTATPNPVVSGSNITLDASASSDPDGTIVGYTWDPDGNGVNDIVEDEKPTITIAYAKPGTYTAKLQVRDNSGTTSTTTVTITVQNRAPNASFTASPNPVSPNATATFDASASKDPDGTIAKYEWDLDGNGSYETNTGTKATATRSYSSEGTINVGLRITDNSGATATVSNPLTVKNQAPTASFTATPNPVNTNATVSFSASASVDPDGSISKYEWDLDGNGTYETNTGTTKTTSRSYSTPGEITVGLRVTDNKGATGTTTRAVTIQNQLPVPSFTATPNPTTAGSTVSFNGAGSKDPDGSITQYEWDLDGNGTFETNTGTTTTTSRNYPTATEPVISLRVTDNRGAAATTTKTLAVRGPYNNAVSTTSGLINYWRLGEASGTSLDDPIGGRDATALNGVTLGTAGNLTLDSNTAASFDGTNDAAQASLNLSGTSKLTLEFWLKWNAFANDDKLAFEFTSNFNNSDDGFLVNPNSSSSSGRFEVAMGRNNTRNSIYFTRPSAGAWHHYAFVFNAALFGPSITPYVDGKAVSFSKGASNLGGGNFANSTLNFMSRNASSLFGAGSLDEVALYNQTLTSTQISQHFTAR